MYAAGQSLSRLVFPQQRASWKGSRQRRSAEAVITLEQVVVENTNRIVTVEVGVRIIARVAGSFSKAGFDSIEVLDTYAVIVV